MEEKETFMSVEIGAISTAVSAFQGEIEQPALNRENPYFNSRYVDLSGVLKSVQKLLAKNGLAVMQIISGNDIITLLTHKSGQWFKSVCPSGNYKSQQDRGSAITYTKRYALCAILGIAADTDDDGNAATDADKKRNANANANAQQAAFFSGAQLKEALGELNDCQTNDDIQKLWSKWVSIAPAMCNKGTDFYQAVSEKSKAINAQ